MTRSSSRRNCLACAVIALLAAAGCGRSTGSLSGTVTYKGERLRGGNVSFISTEGYPSAAASIQEDGTYTVPKLVAGNYQVTVETDSLAASTRTGGPGPGGMMPPGARAPGNSSGPPGQAKGKDLPKNVPPKGITDDGGALASGYKMSNPGDAMTRYIKIPAKYKTATESNLSFTADGTTQTWNIALE